MAPGYIFLLFLLCAGVLTVIILALLGVFSSSVEPSVTGTLHPEGEWSERVFYDFNIDGQAAVDHFLHDYHFDSTDYNGGNVSYVSNNSAGLVSLNGDSQLQLGISQTGSDTCMQAVWNPNVFAANPQMCVDAVKLISNFTIVPNKLVIIKASSIPGALATWPAWWSTGADWPNNGEFDTVETANSSSVAVPQVGNASTMHTSPDCDQPDRAVPALSNPQGYNDCGEASGYQGCGSQLINVDSATSGIFVWQWEVTDDLQSGFSNMYYFPYSSTVAADPGGPLSGTPDPSLWTAHMYAQFEFGPDNCTMGHLGPQNSILNTNFCGEWAGATFPSYDGKTGQDACTAYVNDLNLDPSNTNTQWRIDTIRIWSKGADRDI